MRFKKKIGSIGAKLRFLETFKVFFQNCASHNMHTNARVRTAHAPKHQQPIPDKYTLTSGPGWVSVQTFKGCTPTTLDPPRRLVSMKSMLLPWKILLLPCGVSRSPSVNVLFLPSSTNIYIGRIFILIRNQDPISAERKSLFRKCLNVRTSLQWQLKLRRLGYLQRSRLLQMLQYIQVHF